MKIQSIKHCALFLLILYTTLNAQVSPGARQIALSHSGIALSDDIFALFNNPAGLAQLNWRELGIYYSPSPFGFKEMANAYAAYLEPFSFGNISIGYMKYGYELYSENKISLGLARSINTNFMIGAALLYQNLAIARYGNDNTFVFNLGGLYYFSPATRIGFYSRNLFGATYGSEPDQIPFVLAAGISHDYNQNIIINLGIEKELDYDPSFKVGVEYQPIQFISLRTGFNNQPSSYSFGIGIHYSFLNLDYAAFTHQELGLTHQAGLIIDFDPTGTRRSKIQNYLFKNK